MKKVSVTHLHGQVKTGRGRKPEAWSHPCYWTIFEEDGTDDGKHIADVKSNLADALKMAEAVGVVVLVDDHEDSGLLECVHLSDAQKAAYAQLLTDCPNLVGS